MDYSWKFSFLRIHKHILMYNMYHENTAQSNFKEGQSYLPEEILFHQ